MVELAVVDRLIPVGHCQSASSWLGYSVVRPQSLGEIPFGHYQSSHYPSSCFDSPPFSLFEISLVRGEHQPSFTSQPYSTTQHIRILALLIAS